MSRLTLVFVGTAGLEASDLPTRPAALLRGFLEVDAFKRIHVVRRLRPRAFLQKRPRGRTVWAGGLIGTVRRLSPIAGVVEHPWPFGWLEERFVQAILRRIAADSRGPVVVWVADPKSVAAATPREPRAWRLVVDAYDAWDQSPLVRGPRRQEAVRRGYEAAREADLVFTNTALMCDRMRALGATDVRVLPNGCPDVDPPAHLVKPQSGLVYVGRIHERFDARLVAGVARALPDVPITIAGPIERAPDGWAAIEAAPSVRLPGRIDPATALSMIESSAAVIIPHVVDDYTRSQDSMKAWEAVACGVPVVSTAIPPCDSWPAGLASVCASDADFIAACQRASRGELEANRPGRLAFARANRWADRAAVAIAAIEEVAGVARSVR